jgi:hypothetical protein
MNLLWLGYLQQNMLRTGVSQPYDKVDRLHAMLLHLLLHTSIVTYNIPLNHDVAKLRLPQNSCRRCSGRAFVKPSAI